jgi:hypothetical protein
MQMMKSIRQRFLMNLGLLINGLLMSSIAVAQNEACSDITLLDRAVIRPGTNVRIYIRGGEPSGAQGVTQAAIWKINGMINLVTFSINSNSPPPTSDKTPRIEITFNNNLTTVAGQYIGNYDLNDPHKTLTRGELNLGMGVRGCNPGNMSELCYNPSEAGYREAVESTLIHELLHSLRLSESSLQNVMGRFAGVNNRGNSNLNIDCVIRKGRELHTAAGNPNC